MNTASRKRLGWILAVIFVVSMIMATGPGVLLVNRPVMVLGLPVLYVWAIAWYFVQAAVVIAAYWFVWRSPDELNEGR